MDAACHLPRGPVLDGVVIQSLSSSPSFIAFAPILIIGGLLAVLGRDKAIAWGAIRRSQRAPPR